MAVQNGSSERPLDEMKEAYIYKEKDAVDLANELKQLIDATTEENYDPALIDAYLDALDEKAPMPPPPSNEEAKERFRQRLQALSTEIAPESPSEAKKSVRKHRFGRTVLTVAATLVILSALLIGAQASGVNVFGALARWTNDVFHLGTTSKANSDTYNNIIRVLEEHDFPKGLVPIWYPEGFEASEPNVYEDNFGVSVQVDFVHPDGRYYYISFDHYSSSDQMLQMVFEKNDTTVEQYAVNGKVFNIVSNIDRISAVWSDELTVEMIQGNLSLEDIKSIIDSIGVD